MWTQITDLNSELIKVGTSISQNYSVNHIDNNLETIYKVVNINISGDIHLKTENLVKITNIQAKRIVNKKKLIDEGWFMLLSNNQKLK